MKKIILFFIALCVFNIGQAQLEVKKDTTKDFCVAMIADPFSMHKYAPDDTYILIVDCTANKLGLNKDPKYVIMNLGNGKDNAIQSITLLLEMCKGNTIKGTTITDHKGNTFQVSSSVFPDSPQVRMLNIEKGAFLESCIMTEDALELLLVKLNKE